MENMETEMKSGYCVSGTNYKLAMEALRLFEAVCEMALESRLDAHEQIKLHAWRAQLYLLAALVEALNREDEGACGSGCGEF